MIDKIIKDVTLKEAYDIGRRDGMLECLEEINKLIKPGPTSGKGWDKLAERNGIVLATIVVTNKLYGPIEPGNKRQA